MSRRGAVIALCAAGRRLTVEAAAIRQIVVGGDVLQLPLARRDLAGVLAHEGRAIPVWRLADLGPDRSPAGAAGGPEEQIAIIEHDGVLAGILIESADAVAAGAAPPETTLDARAVLAAAGIVERDAGGKHAGENAKGESRDHAEEDSAG